jgi:hypothetical protein
MGSTSPNKRTSKSGTPLVGSPFSDPGLPSLSSSPQRFFIDRTLSLDSFSPFENEQQQQQQQQRESERSTSFNETEVVLDDGSLIKRTVSLSTLPDQQEQDGSISQRSDRWVFFFFNLFI